MKKPLYNAASALMITGLSTIVAAASCPDSYAIDHSPTPPEVKEISFDHWSSSTISALYKPYHMVHDALVAEGSEATIVGKFDYDKVLHKDLEDEEINVFIYGTGMSSWESVGTFTTDSDGKIYVPVGKRDKGHYRVRMVVRGDLSYAEGYLSVIAPGTQSVLFDIDGTLTLNELEAAGDYLGIDTATPYYYAAETVNAYKAKGYCITYLSARPYWLMKDTRKWLTAQGIPLLHTHTNPNGEIFEAKDHAAFKADYMKSLQASGLDIIRVYGNAKTDIEAYATAGIPKAQTYIIGDNAGKEDTQAITSNYSYHYSTVVEYTPTAK